MAHIKLTNYTPPDSKQYMADSYPRDGAYLTPNGLFIRCGGCVYAINNGPWHDLVDGGSPSGAPGAVDAHRLLDQVIELARGGR